MPCLLQIVDEKGPEEKVQKEDEEEKEDVDEEEESEEEQDEEPREKAEGEGAGELVSLFVLVCSLGRGCSWWL